MRLFILLIALLCVNPLVSAEENQPVPLLELDAALHGVWYVHAQSTDGGVTVRRVSPPTSVLRASATSMLLADGTTIRITEVYSFTNDGRPGNLVFLSNDRKMTIKPVNDGGMFLAQIWAAAPAGGHNEIDRWLFDVRR